MKQLFNIFSLIVILSLYSCVVKETSSFDLIYPSGYTDIEIKNMSREDSVKVYLTIQAPNSVIGMFGITDTLGSCSQGFFIAKKNRTYFLNKAQALYGFNISFNAPPMACDGAITSGFKNGINIFEGSINCEYEVFDISCVDGANCILKASVSDTTNWSTGDGSFKKTFRSATNNVKLGTNCGIRGVFPYRCSDCIKINPSNIPKNCFNLPVQCDNQRICQVARTKKAGGNIILEYYGNEDIANKKADN